MIHLFRIIKFEQAAKIHPKTRNLRKSTSRWVQTSSPPQISFDRNGILTSLPVYVKNSDLEIRFTVQSNFIAYHAIKVYKNVSHSGQSYITKISLTDHLIK